MVGMAKMLIRDNCAISWLMPLQEFPLARNSGYLGSEEDRRGHVKALEVPNIKAPWMLISKEVHLILKYQVKA